MWFHRTRLWQVSFSCGFLIDNLSHTPTYLQSASFSWIIDTSPKHTHTFILNSRNKIFSWVPRNSYRICRTNTSEKLLKYRLVGWVEFVNHLVWLMYRYTYLSFYQLLQWLAHLKLPLAQSHNLVEISKQKHLVYRHQQLTCQVNMLTCYLTNLLHSPPL